MCFDTTCFAIAFISSTTVLPIARRGMNGVVST
jgi:hypothetical protein